MTTRTPGPWTVSDDNGLRIDAGSTDHVIAMAQYIPEKKEEAYSNARLIAAAPELLEALKLMQASLRASGQINATVDNAIAKAEGRL